MQENSDHEAALASRLKELGQRVDQIKDQQAKQDVARKTDNSALAKGLKLTAEFVSGIIVGTALGLGIDHFFGTKPWGLLLFMIAGFAAGMLNMARSVSKTQG